MTAARWACVLAALGAVAYLLLDPATADHAAQEYRAGLVRDGGLGLWDNGWFAGHHTPAYSLLSPALGALLGVRLAGALAAVVAAGLFGLLAEHHWGAAARGVGTAARGVGAAARDVGAAAGRVAAAWFALGALAMLVSGRLAFLLGVAIGLGALLALQRARPLLAWALALLTPLASPVAGLFLALAALARGIAAGHRRPDTSARRSGDAAAPAEPAGPNTSTPAEPAGPNTSARAEPAGPSTSARAEPAGPNTSAPAELAGLSTSARAQAGRRVWSFALVPAALAPAAILALLFPEGGTEPFAASAFWPALVAIALVVAALPARERTLRIGAAVYGLTCIAAFAFATPLGGNATRLGALVAGPVLAAALLAARPRRPLLLAALALPLAYWQLYPAVRDVMRASGDPSTAAAYHAPLVRFLRRRPGSFRVEIPLTENHWEAAYVAPHVPLARGWERQLDRRYGALFYDGTLSPATYRAWLDDHAVAYVAVPDVALDDASRAEAQLVEGGLAYLRPVWHDAHWRVFAVRRPAPLVAGAAGTIALEPDAFTLRARRRGNALVRVRYTRWWAVTGGSACVERGKGDMTRVRVLRPGTVRVQARLAGPACKG